MTTLAVNVARSFVLGNENDFPAMQDIFFEGSAVGVVDATGHARPLTSVDRFVGFVQEKLDASLVAAAVRNVRVKKRGVVALSVSGAVITDVGQPVYATDDDTFVFSPVASVFIGKVVRFVSAGIVDVEFDAGNMADPYALAGRVWETFSSSTTTDKLDTAKAFWVDTDAQTMTLLAEAVTTAQDLLFVNGGAFGTIAVSVDPNAADLIAGPDDTGAAGGIMVNTKATARRGDFVQISQTADEGWHVIGMRGIWTIA
jgi:hypothetical protein